MNKYPTAQLLLAGNGPEKEHLEQTITEYGLQKNVKMLGYVTNLQCYQHIVDVAVSCSKREGLPLNIVEAMLSGTPVVASENRGHRELIRDGKNGYLVSVNDTYSMSKHLIELFDNEENYKKIQLNAEIYAKNYSFANVKKELEGIYFGN